MENYDPAYFFTKTIAIGDALNVAIDAAANFNLKIGNEGTLLNATVSYKNFDEKPEISRQINYKLIYKDKILIEGQAKTDQSGKINITYLLKKEYLPQHIILNTEFIKNDTYHMLRNLK
jgi:hypothetical protein